MTQDTNERSREALSYIPPEDRDTWVRMAMAIKSELGDEGFDLWDEWSQGAENYSASSARTVWKGIQEAGAITIASLFYEARQHGWNPSGSYRPREMTDAERGERERRMREAEEQRRQENARARQQGHRIFKAATHPDAHDYLERKQVGPTDTLRQIPVAIATKILGYELQANEHKLEGDLLVVPLKAGADFVGVELIDRDGRKSTPYGTAAKGAFWSPEPLPDGDGTDRRVLIGEGVATMLSARQALPGDVCIASRTAGNPA
jgi:putative DNA primase/helicase